MLGSASQRQRPSGNWFENIASGLVILVALFFVAFLYMRTGTGHFGSYPLLVRLPDAAGLAVGKDVRVGGVKVGEVSGLSLDPLNYSAIAEVSMRDDLRLPADSTAAVISSLMGESYLEIAPGHSANTVPSGGTIGGRAAKSGHPAAGT